MEAAEEGDACGEKASVCVPGAELFAPRPVPRPRRFGWDQETLQAKTQQSQAMGV